MGEMASVLSFTEKLFDESASTRQVALQKAAMQDYESLRRDAHYQTYKKAGGEADKFEYKKRDYRTYGFKSKQVADEFIKEMQAQGENVVVFGTRVQGNIVVDVQKSSTSQTNITDFENLYNVEAKRFEPEYVEVQGERRSSTEATRQYHRSLIEETVGLYGLNNRAVSTVLQVAHQNQAGRSTAYVVGGDTVVINGKVVDDPHIRADVLDKHQDRIHNARQFLKNESLTNMAYRSEGELIQKFEALGFDKDQAVEMTFMNKEEFTDFMHSDTAKDVFAKSGITMPDSQIKIYAKDVSRLTKNSLDKTFQHRADQLHNEAVNTAAGKNVQKYRVSTDVDQYMQNVGEYSFNGLDAMIDEYNTMKIAKDVMAKQAGFKDFEAMSVKAMSPDTPQKIKDKFEKIQRQTMSRTEIGLNAIKKDLGVDLIAAGFGTNAKEIDRKALVELQKIILDKATAAGIVLGKGKGLDIEKLQRLSIQDLKKLGISGETRDMMVKIASGYKHDLSKNPAAAVAMRAVYKITGGDEDVSQGVSNAMTLGRQTKNVLKTTHKIANTDAGLIGKINKYGSNKGAELKNSLNNVLDRSGKRAAQKQQFAAKKNAKAAKGIDKKYESIKKGEKGLLNKMENAANKNNQTLTKNITKKNMTKEASKKAAAEAAKKKAAKEAAKKAATTGKGKALLEAAKKVGSAIAKWAMGLVGGIGGGGTVGIVLGAGLVIIIIIFGISSFFDAIEKAIIGVIAGDDYVNKSVAYNLSESLTKKQTDEFLGKNLIINEAEIYNNRANMRWGDKFYAYSGYFNSLSGVSVDSSNKIQMYPFGTNVPNNYVTTLSTFDGRHSSQIVANFSSRARQAAYTDYDEGGDFVSMQSGHTNNIKDIICMIDTMYDMEIEKNGETTHLTNVIGSTPYEMDKGTYMNTFVIALKWIGSWFTGNTSDWDTFYMENTNDVSYKTVKIYAETMYDATHQNVYTANVDYFTYDGKNGMQGQAAQFGYCTSPVSSNFKIQFYKNPTTGQYMVTPYLVDNSGVTHQLYNKNISGYEVDVNIPVDAASPCLWNGMVINKTNYDKVVSESKEWFAKHCWELTTNSPKVYNDQLFDYFHYEGHYWCTNSSCAAYHTPVMGYSEKCPYCNNSMHIATGYEKARSIVYTIEVDSELTNKDIYKTSTYLLSDSELKKLLAGTDFSKDGSTITRTSSAVSTSKAYYDFEVTGCTPKEACENALWWYKTNSASPYVYAETYDGMSGTDSYFGTLGEGYTDLKMGKTTGATNYVASSSLTENNVDFTLYSLSGRDFEKDLKDGKISEANLSGNKYTSQTINHTAYDGDYNYIHSILGLFVVPQRDADGNYKYETVTNPDGSQTSRLLREYANYEVKTVTTEDGKTKIVVHANVCIKPSKEIKSTTQVYTRNCKGHDYFYCGGHIGFDNMGVVYSMTNEQLSMVGVRDDRILPLATDMDLKEMGYGEVIGKIDRSTLDYSSTAAVLAASGAGRNLLIDVQGSFAGQNGLNIVVDTSDTEYNGWGTGLEVKQDTIGQYLYRDIFDIDTTIKKGHNIFSTRDMTQFEGWTADKMTLAIGKYGMDWYELYGIDIPENIGADTLAKQDIDLIMEKIQDYYTSYTIPDNKREVMETLLMWVGRNNYSPDSHTHSLTYLMDKGTVFSTEGKTLDYSCTCSAGNGNSLANYMYRLLGYVGTEQNFSSVNAGYMGASPVANNCANVYPLDVMVHIPANIGNPFSTTSDLDEAYILQQDSKAETVIFLGKVKEDVELSTGQVLKADVPIVLTLSGNNITEQYGTIAIRAEYDDDNIITDTELFHWIQNPDSRTYKYSY